MGIQYNDLSPSSGDSTNVTLQKMLQRLNLNSQISTEPQANVTVIGSVPIDIDNWPASQTVDGNVTVDGTVNAAQSGTWYVRLLDGAGNVLESQDGHLSVVNAPFDFEIAHDSRYLDKIARIFLVIGRRSGFNSTSVLQDVGAWLGTSIDVFPELTGAEDLELVSSSAQDDATPLGTGTHVVQICYLDLNQDMQIVNYNMNGLTPVPVSEKMLFVYWMEAYSGGTSEVSVGNISLRVAGGGAIHEQISAGGNRSLSARFRVPRLYDAFIPAWSVSSIGTTQDVRLRATVRNFLRSLGSRYTFQDVLFAGSGTHQRETPPYLKYPPETKIKVSTIPGAAPIGNRIDCTFQVLLIHQ